MDDYCPQSKNKPSSQKNMHCIEYITNRRCADYLWIHELSLITTLWPNSEHQVIVYRADLLLWTVWLCTIWSLYTQGTRTAIWWPTTTGGRWFNSAPTLDYFSRSFHLAVGTHAERWSVNRARIEAHVKHKHTGLANDIRQFVGTICIAAHFIYKCYLSRWNTLGGILRSWGDCSW